MTAAERPSARPGAALGAPVPAEATTVPETGAWRCSWGECTTEAVAAVRFHQQLGHVHECEAHLARLREWSDVAVVVPLPCPWSHGSGVGWIDYPRDLE